MKVGDLVKMKRGYSEPGIILEVEQRARPLQPAARALVAWPDYGLSKESITELEIIKS